MLLCMIVQDVGIQVSRSGKMEVDEDSSADLGPEYSINEMSSLDVDCVQSAARNFQGKFSISCEAGFCENCTP